MYSNQSAVKIEEHGEFERASHSSEEAALKKYFQALSELKTLGIITNQKDFTCQIGEWLVANLYEGVRAESGIQKDWDIVVNGKYIQVKAAAKGEKTVAGWHNIKYKPEARIDELVIVVFTPEYKIKSFYKAPWSFALEKIRRAASGDAIHWKDLKDYEVDVKDLPKQHLVKIFI